MTDNTNTDPRDDSADQVEDAVTDTPAEDAVTDTPAEGAVTDTPAEGDEDDDLGAGAFDVPASEGEDHSAADASAVGADADGEASSADEDAGDTKPRKAYLGRPELAPLYAMAGLADLAASVVRDIANEQIAAYRARRTKDETGAEGQGEEGDAQFNAFLAKAQQRTQELFDQAVTQYEHLADRGRVAVGEAFESARQQQRTRGQDDIIRMKPEDVSEAAQKAADKIAAAVQTAADRVSRAAEESASKDSTTGDAAAGPTDSAPSDSGPADSGPRDTGAAASTDTDAGSAGDTEDKPGASA